MCLVRKQNLFPTSIRAIPKYCPLYIACCQCPNLVRYVKRAITGKNCVKSLTNILVPPQLYYCTFPPSQAQLLYKGIKLTNISVMCLCLEIINK